jgi:hypothetical protein
MNRSRDEIEKEIEKIQFVDYDEFRSNKIIIELLLDIREKLEKMIQTKTVINIENRRESATTPEPKIRTKLVKTKKKSEL